MMPNRILTVVLTATLLFGCMTVGPDYRRPKIDTPDVWPGEKTEAPVPVQWWHSYNDPVLDKMIEEALAHNADLALAIARVDEARAQLAATADLFKALGGGWETDLQRERRAE